jgi:REP-associated tyrosine transposase
MARELNVTGRVWQEEFFDHVLRSNESYSQKWEYVKENPVRAGLVKKSEDWPFQSEIESLAL